MKIWREHRLDAALLLLALVVLALAVTQDSTSDRVGSLVGTVALVALLGRRRWPVPSAVVAFAAIGAASQIAPQSNSAEFFAILATFGTVGSLERRRDAITGWLVGCTVLAVSLADNPYTEGASDVALTLTFCTVIWAAGLLAAERGRQVAVEQDRADSAESTRTEHVRIATEHERARIAAELHDIVSHGLSIVVVQAVAARMGLSDGADGDEIDGRLDVVESTARDALADMRRMLDLLQPTAEAGDRPDGGPTVGLAGLPELADQVRAADVPVALHVDETLELPAGLDAACFRIVQESLTNVVKHAPGAPTTVDVRAVAGGLEIVVANERPTREQVVVSGAGHGLIGMRQRVQLYGGSVETAPRRGGFRVTASLPFGTEERRSRPSLLRVRRRSS